MDKRYKFIAEMNKLLRSVNYTKLRFSCNTPCLDYAKEFLQKMHQAFVDVYETDCITDESLGFIDVPAVIRGSKSGDLYLGLVTVDLESSGEHYNTIFLTEIGVLDQGEPDSKKNWRKTFFENLGRYDYWYTPEIPGDIHVNFDQIPHRVEELLKSCVGMEPTQKMAVMDGIQ